MLEALERPRRLKLWTDEFQNDIGQNHEKKRKRLRERRRKKGMRARIHAQKAKISHTIYETDGAIQRRLECNKKPTSGGNRRICKYNSKTKTQR